MANLSDLNMKEVKENSFEAIPPGDYRAIITESERKATKDGTGERINLKIQIADGKFQNRTLFDGLNIKNKSDVAQQIGRAQLKAVMVAVNKPNANATEELHNIPLIVSVKVGKDQDGNPRNEIKGYKAALPKPAAKPAAAPAKNMVEEAFEEQPAEAAPVKKNPFAAAAE